MSKNFKSFHLDIFYEDLRYVAVDEAKLDEEAGLISDIGGQLGLWLGCSILTLVEMFY